MIRFTILELFVIVFFWVGMWGIIEILTNGILEQLGNCLLNKFFLFLIITIASFYILWVIYQERDCDDNSDN